MLRWLAALLLLLTAGLAEAQTFPKLTGRVVDDAHLLSAEQVAQLTQLSEGVEQASSRQLVVATVPDLQGYDVQEYGYKLGRAWAIGQKDANNGIILLVAPSERKVGIEVGTGLEPIMTDALSSVIINQTILPRFRSGDMGGGIVAGAQAIAEQLKLPLEAGEQRARQQVAASQRQRQRRSGVDQGDMATAIFWVIVILVIVIPLIARSSRGRRYRGGSAPVILWGPGLGGGGWGGGGGSSGGWGGGGGGGFSGGGGSFGGGGASGGW